MVWLDLIFMLVIMLPVTWLMVEEILSEGIIAKWYMVDLAYKFLVVCSYLLIWVGLWPNQYIVSLYWYYLFSSFLLSAEHIPVAPLTPQL